MSAATMLLRVTRAAVHAAVLIMLAAGFAGCGGSEKGAAQPEVVVSLYVLDHDGADPQGNAIEPYTKAFLDLRQGCSGTDDELANSVLTTANEASNGSGTKVTNLDALRAVAKAVGTTQQDCAGVFVGVEARLEGSALNG